MLTAATSELCKRSPRYSLVPILILCRDQASSANMSSRLAQNHRASLLCVRQPSVTTLLKAWLLAAVPPSPRVHISLVAELLRKEVPLVSSVRLLPRALARARPPWPTSSLSLCSAKDPRIIAPPLNHDSSVVVLDNSNLLRRRVEPEPPWTSPSSSKRRESFFCGVRSHLHHIATPQFLSHGEALPSRPPLVSARGHLFRLTVTGSPFSVLKPRSNNSNGWFPHFCKTGPQLLRVYKTAQNFIICRHALSNQLYTFDCAI